MRMAMYIIPIQAFYTINVFSCSIDKNMKYCYIYDNIPISRTVVSNQHFFFFFLLLY